jgi:hypothetical protein
MAYTGSIDPETLDDGDERTQDRKLLNRLRMNWRAPLNPFASTAAE